MMKPLAITFVLAATAAAHADTGEEIAVGSTFRSLHSDSANAVTGDSLVGGRIAYGYRLPIALPEGFALFGAAAFDASSAKGTMFGNLDTSIALYQLSLGAELRYRVIPHVAAFAHAALGTARDSLHVTDSSGHTASDAGWGGMTSGSIGVDLFAADSSLIDIGLRVELGYTLATAVALAPTPEHPSDDTIRLDMTSASMGHLDLGGTSFSIGLVSRF